MTSYGSGADERIHVDVVLVKEIRHEKLRSYRRWRCARATDAEREFGEKARCDCETSTLAAMVRIA